MELETELDYEEEDSNGFDDEYLRIDLSEEEENFFSGEPQKVDTECVKKQKIWKVNKKGEEPHVEGTSSEKEQFTQTSSLDESKSYCHDVAVKNVQKKKCQLPSQLYKNKTKIQCPSHSLKGHLSVGHNVMKPPVLSVFNNQRLSLSHTPVEPLLTLNAVTQEQELKSKRFRPVQTFSSNSSSRSSVSSHTLFQQRNEPVISHPDRNFNNNVQTEFQNNERKKFYRNPAFKDKTEVMLKDEVVKRPDILPKPKPDISKELLLKKRNPFDTKVEPPYHTPVIKVKEENVEGKQFNPEVHQRLREEEEAGKGLNTSNSTCKGVYAVKADAKSHVKFVRTISKSFDELTQKRVYPSSFSHSQLREVPFTQGNLKRSSPSKDPYPRYVVEGYRDFFK